MSSFLPNQTPLSRRSLIQAGALGGLGLTLPGLLSADQIGATNKSCIFIVIERVG